MKKFTHIHVHSQYSILDGASSISGLVDKAKNDGMTAVALTDHGNMFGAKLFHNTATKAGIKPILGVEAYVSRTSRHDKKSKEDRSGNHLIILAKNKIGYHNLVKIVSYSWIEGYYYKPRIDKELLFQYKEGLIISSACLGGAVPQAIMKGDIENAENLVQEYKSVFGEDYYLELQRHRTGNPAVDAKVYDFQVDVNKELIRISEKFGVKLIATNDVHYINAEDADPHDILICLNTGKDKDDPNRMKYTGQEFFKTTDEMWELFSDVPQALENTMEIADKIEEYKLDTAPIMPDFPLPDGFDDEDEYLRHITYEGVKKRWSEITPEITERVEFELSTIKKMGFPGYFLIVWDFLKAAREMGVSVGPGRGSAAGSAVAYCLWITDIDPIAFDLLFERFLNPDRISMPDIDIDLDEDGRERVLEWVVKKYGQKRVAHIVTFGKMAPKMAIRDVARVEKLPLQEADRLAKMIPEKSGTTFKKALEQVPELVEERDNGIPEIRKTLGFAQVLEGSVRQTGVHACGIIIGKDDLENYIPLSINKEAKLFVTQYEGKFVEDVGMLKMDFLGLKTLSIIKDAIENIKLSKGIDVEVGMDKLEDEKTYQLYAKGETTGLFQFESDGMKKYLRQLKPNRFEDLIAMNALYRPGPMDYIPSFINRKHGREPIHYDLPGMEEYLAESYGITVFQEQVMLLSQKLANFTKGEADTVRKAMGKKKFDLLAQLKPKFLDQGEKNGHPRKILEKIWKDWEAFASYAFNKSHSTCYAFVSFQTAYLKAHYPAEFMAALLSRNITDINKITIFMDECRRMGLAVLGPDVNESYAKFTVNKQGAIRFGMAAIKGVGEAAVNEIIAERERNGQYKDVSDFVERINLQTVNKRNIEGLVIAGGFDELSGDMHRSQFFAETGDGTFIEQIVRYGNKFKLELASSQQSLFGNVADSGIINKPKPPVVESWSKIDRLNREKELIGIYLSAHPLDDYKLEINNFTNIKLSELGELSEKKGRDFKLAGIVTKVEHRLTKTGKPFGSMVIEDYTDSLKLTFFGKKYIEYKNLMVEGYSLFLKAKVEHRFGNPQNDLELDVYSVEHLSELKDQKVGSIALKIDVDKITHDLLTDIEEIATKFKGQTLLKFLIFEPETKIWVQMYSKSHRVEVNQDFIDQIEGNPDIMEYKIA